MALIFQQVQTSGHQLHLKDYLTTPSWLVVSIHKVWIFILLQIIMQPFIILKNYKQILSNRNIDNLLWKNPKVIYEVNCMKRLELLS